MKLSELNTDQALDALCEMTPYISNIVADEAVVNAVGKMLDNSQPLNLMGKSLLLANRMTEAVPLLLKTHRPDVYGILSVMNGKSVKQIAAQPVLDTMRQTAELFRDEDLLSFFRLSAQPGPAPRSAPSAPSPGSG